MSREIIIADASCLIVLQNIQELDLLQKVFSEVIITDEVKNEFGLDLPAWIKVRRIQNKTQQVTLNLILDNGEASAIALLLEIADALLIIDEEKRTTCRAGFELKNYRNSRRNFVGETKRFD